MNRTPLRVAPRFQIDPMAMSLKYKSCAIDSSSDANEPNISAPERDNPMAKLKEQRPQAKYSVNVVI